MLRLWQRAALAGEGVPLALLPALLTLSCTTRDVVATLDETAANTGIGGSTTGSETSNDAAAIAACDALFCADFESPLAAESTAGDGGNLSQDCDRSYGGDCSLLATTEEGGGTAYLDVDLTDGDAFFLRAYLRVPSDLVLTDLTLFHLGAPGARVGLNVDLREEDRFEVYLAEEERSVLSEPGAVVRDAWFCLQLAVGVDDAQGTVALSVDGVEVASASAADTHPPDGVSLFTVGIDWSADDQVPGAIGFDDVILDDRAVPCL